jgi:hypothetical protein
MKDEDAGIAVAVAVTMDLVIRLRLTKLPVVAEGEKLDDTTFVTAALPNIVNVVVVIDANDITNDDGRRCCDHFIRFLLILFNVNCVSFVIDFLHVNTLPVDHNNTTSSTITSYTGTSATRHVL